MPKVFFVILDLAAASGEKMAGAGCGGADGLVGISGGLHPAKNKKPIADDNAKIFFVCFMRRY